MEPSLRQLRYFCALVETGHFGEAAAKVNISQPALSIQIKALEQVLELRLIERRKNGHVITPVGREIAERANAILDDVRDLQNVARRSRGLSGRLNLGVIPTIAPYLLPISVPLLRAQNITLDLRIREAQTHVLVAELLAGNLDAALLALPSKMNEAHEITLFSDRFLLAGKQQVIDAEMPMKPTDIKPGRLLLLDEGHCLADQALEVCAFDRSQTRMDLGATSLTTLSGLASEGLGLTFLPEISLKMELAASPNLAVRRFDDPEPKRTIGLVRRSVNSDEDWFHELGEILQKAGRILTGHARATYPV